MNEKTKKALPYIAINTIGAILVLLCFFIEHAANIGYSCTYIVVLILVIKPVTLIVFPVIILAVNACAFMKTENNKTDAAILCSVLFGSLGGFIAVSTVNKAFEKAETVKIIFNVHLWLSAYLAVSYLLYSYGYYNFSIFP